MVPAKASATLGTAAKRYPRDGRKVVTLGVGPRVGPRTHGPLGPAKATLFREAAKRYPRDGRKVEREKQSANFRGGPWGSLGGPKVPWSLGPSEGKRYLRDGRKALP